MKYLLLCIIISLCACTTQKKYDIVYMSEASNKYVKERLDKCKQEAAYLTLLNYEAHGRVWTKEQVMGFDRMMVESCIKFYKLYI